MAAQGAERKFNICDRCFASVPPKEPFCPECGAPIVVEEQDAGSSDAVVYTELARANLLRMRGEYKQAENQCLNILKRFPNNASANTLLADISAEQNGLTQAVQWFELSLDLTPDDDAVKNKLKSARDRISLQEAANTAKELGMAHGGPQRTRIVIAAEPVTDIDVSAADRLVALCEELRAQTIALDFAEMKGPVKDRLRAYTDEAVRRGAFGAPTIFVGDQMFFGNDRLDFVERALLA